MKKLKYQTINVSKGALIIAALIAPGSVVCHAAVLGWTPTGDVSGQTSAFNGGSTPAPGNSDQVVATTIVSAPPIYVPYSGTSAVSGTALESALGLSSGVLSAQGHGTVSEASGFMETLNLNAGDTLTIRWNFLTGAEPGAAGSDYAFYTLHQGTGSTSLNILADVNSGTHVVSGGLSQVFGFETGYQNSTSFSVPNSGSWTLGFGVADISGSTGVDSALGLASVTVSPVPEPWAWSLISALALGGLA